MEKLIKQFLSGDGNGDGNGDGDGYGNGYGNGNGDGDGNGDGNGNGYGYGDGDGNGNGNGDGNGDGNGYGDGDGDGDGNGNGDGDGYGNGNGDGNGDGNGNGDGDGIKLSTFHGNKVYYIDGIPGVFKSIKGNIALLDCINISDFSVEQMYVVKKGNHFAHGYSIKEATEAVDIKYYRHLDKEATIEEFKKGFKPGVTYSNSEFYKWHTILTGSCNAGKDLFMKQSGLSIDGQMTVDEFIKITANAYGGEVIRSIKYK